MKSMNFRDTFKASLILILLAVFPCFAASIWTDGGSGYKWTTSSNWSGGLPHSSVDAVVDFVPGGSGPLIESGDNASCNVLRGPGDYDSRECVLTMTGGALQAVAVKIANNASGVGKFLQQGGTLSIVNRLQPGFKGVGTYEMTGGTMTAGQGLRIGYISGSTGYAVIHDGQCLSDLIHVGGEGNGNLIINGGLVDCTGGSGAVLVPEDDITGSGHIQLNGGILKASSIVFKSTGSMDITGGQFILTGDVTLDIKDYVDLGVITAHDGRGEVLYEYTSGQTVVTASAVDYAVAWNPSPEHRAVLEVWDSEPMTVTWSAGDFADAHDVYFGTSYEEVLAGDPEVYRGRQSSTSYTWPEMVEIGQVFYWRIDEVNTSTQEVWPGSVWMIQIKDQVMIDDFDGYANDTQLQNGWQSNYSNPTGAQISLTVDDRIYVYVNQSMKIDFMNPSGPHYGEVVKTLAPSQNWASNNIQSLSFRYFGHPDVEQLIVKVSDGSNTSQFSTDKKDILTLEQWQAVDIDLDDFAGINLSQVQSISIGAVIPGRSVPGQTARIYIDDIALYGPRCMADYTVLDRNGDCLIDIEDAAFWMQDWLLAGYTVNASDPGQTGLRAWYSFDVFAGNTAVDLSGNDFHAAVDACVSCDPWDDTDAVSGYALYLDGTYGVTIPGQVFDTVSTGMTISLWIKADVDPDSPVYPIEFFAGDSSRDASQYKWDMAGIRPGLEDAYTQWTHYAFVKDASGGVMRIYRDGLLAARQKDAAKLMDGSGASDARIGLETGQAQGGFAGRLDEFMIFDRALSHDEVLYLAQGASSSLYQPLLPVVGTKDPVADGAIDYEDFGWIGSNWLSTELWPQ